MTKIIPRAQAIIEGRRTYYTGKPCKYEHLADRWLSNSTCVECMALKNKSYYIENTDKLIEKAQVWKKENIEYNRKREREAGYHKICYRRRREYYIFKAVMRNKRVKQATPTWLNEEHKKQMREIYANRPEGYHVDHIVPIKGNNVCGLHVPWNLQYLPALVNIQKKNHF